MIVEVRRGGLLLTILDNKMSKIIRTSDIKIGNVGGLKLLRLLLEVVREQGGFPDPEASTSCFSVAPSESAKQAVFDNGPAKIEFQSRKVGFRIRYRLKY